MVLGPWPGGQGRHRPARSMDQGWSAWPSPHGLSRGPRIWLVRRMDRGPLGWSAGPSLARSTVRQGGPRCRPSHGLSRGPHDRSGMWPIGPHASTWPIRPPGPWSTVLDAGHGPHGVGMIVDRAGLDGPWPLVDAALRARSARPADGKGGGAVIGLRPLYRVRLCQVLFYSSCRFLVDGVVVTNGNEVVQCDVSRHSPCSDRFKK